MQHYGKVNVPSELILFPAVVVLVVVVLIALPATSVTAVLTVTIMERTMTSSPAGIDCSVKSLAAELGTAPAKVAAETQIGFVVVKVPTATI